MLSQPRTPGARAEGHELDEALGRIAAGAEALDAEPRFPAEAFEELRRCGATVATLPGERGGRPAVAVEWSLLRRVAAADSSVGRILDGHFNAIERINFAAGDAIRERELAAVQRGALLGVWGADPPPGEAEPARLHDSPGGLLLSGAKDFCSGAGGLDAALVNAGREPGEPPWLVLVALDERAEVIHGVFRASGMRASESHRVRFDAAPVRAVLGVPGELVRDPHFSGDAMRTAASWAGMLDAVADAALDDLAQRRAEEPLSQLAAGRIEAARGSVDAWLERGARALEAGEPGLRATSVSLRAEIARAARLTCETASAACGSAPFIAGGRLDRAKRDLELFLLQHRLDPLLARVGAQLLAERGR